MQKFSYFIFTAVLLTSLSEAQINNAGSLTAYVDSLITQIPDVTPSNLYQTPNSAQSALWDSIVEKMLEGNYASAQTDALTIDYEIVHFLDESNSKVYYILRKKGSGTNYWGTVIIDPDPLRSRLVIQAPHPLHDANTGNQAIVVFKNTSAHAFFLAGTHRCNSTLLSSCDGTTSVCGGSNQFRKSDQAHNDDGPFQIGTEVLKRTLPNLIVVQLHGFVKDPGYPDLILGNGTQSAPATDWLDRFKQELSALDGTLQYKIAHVDTAWTTLTGTTNVQGRLINNSPDPCGEAAGTPTGRFLHIEQAYTGLRDNSTNYAKVASAIGNTFPPDKVIASAATGNWENASMWTGSIVPNDTAHVVISSGHTVTVTTATAEAKSVSFSDNTASLALATGSDLSVYGDFTLASGTHNAFTSWAAGAKLTFAGGDDQVLNGWNTDSSSFSTSLMEMVVNKSAGKLVTAGTDMNLNLGTSVEIVDGTFELTAGDDIEGRDLAGSASAPTITVRANGALTVYGDTSYIRSGTADTIAVGLLRNYGRVKFYGTDLITGYNVADIYNEDGGTIEVFTGWKASRLLRTDTLLLKAGSVFETSTTTNVIPSFGRTVLNAGGTYRILGSSVNLSSQFTDNGTFEYASGSAQAVTNRSYKKLVLSNDGAKTITMTANRSADTLILSGGASLALATSSVLNFSVDKQLTMSGGTITTGSDTLVLGQSTASTGSLSRTSGSVVGNFKRYIPASTANDLLFPVGTGAVYRSALLDVTSTPSAGGSLTVSFIAGDPGESGLPLNDNGTEIQNVASEGYWKLTVGDGLTGGTYSLDVTAAGFAGISDVAALRLVQRSTAGAWQAQGTHIAGSGTLAVPVVSRSGLSLVNELGVASGSENPLPVELVAFTAAPSQHGVVLTWKTAAEVNNQGFEIQRSEISGHAERSEEFREWTKAGFVDGNGTTNNAHEYSFHDHAVSAGKYLYRLKQIDRDGNFIYSPEVEAAVGIGPTEFSLEQNYPNPFNPVTMITFTVPSEGAKEGVASMMTTLKVFNALGQEVAVLFHGPAEPGTFHRVTFDGSQLAAGVYIARLSAAGKIRSIRMSLVK